MKKQFIFFLIIIIASIFIFSYRIIQKQSLLNPDEKNYFNQADMADNSSLDSLNITSSDKEKQFTSTARDIIGMWYIISSNPDPKYKDKIITDYTKFTFYPNGKVDRRSFISDEYKVDTGKYIFLEDDNNFPITFNSDDDIKKSDSFWQLTKDGLAESYYKNKKNSLYVKEGSEEWNEREKTTVTTNSLTSFIDPNNLQIGKIYELSNKTPLMSELNPVDPIAALGDMKELGAGSTIKIISSVQKNNTPWYNVSFVNNSSGQVEYGWINSTALIGQSLKEK